MTKLAHSLEQLYDGLPSFLDCKEGADTLYVVGSRRNVHPNHFNKQWSDLDVLLCTDSPSYDHLARRMGRVIEVNDRLRQAGCVADIFLLNSDIVSDYFTSLSVLWGFRSLDTKDLIFGLSISYDLQKQVSNDYKLKLYQSAALAFCNTYSTELPHVETQFARRSAKRILRGLKLIACSFAGASELKGFEERLFRANRVEDVLSEIRSTTLKPKEKSVELFQEILDQAHVKEWADWVTCQYEFAKYFNELRGEITAEYGYESIVKVWNLLTLDLKNILLENDIAKRQMASKRFISEALSATLRLAFHGVEALVDFNDHHTPAKIKEAYDALTAYLEHDTADLEQVAATALLLGYAYRQSLIFFDNMN